MAQSAAKRRKLDDSRSQAVHVAPEASALPTTPTRASYLSPTKSSLARSHPHLATRSSRRSATEPRSNTAQNEQVDDRSQTAKAARTTSRIHKSQEPDVVRDEVIDTSNADLSQAEESASIPAAAEVSERQRRPLEERQPAQERSRERRISSEDPVSPAILPKLVPKKEAAARPATRGQTGEPELPPTPVQLGISAPPDRPRGLGSSSSPRGSKMSSRSRRRRTRSGVPTTSSPLKPKARRRARPGNKDDDEAHDGTREAPESEPEETEKEQRLVLESLRKELETLARDTQKLEGSLDDEEPSEEILALLRETEEVQKLAKDTEEKLLAHLTLFAPANLQLKTSTKTKLVDKRTKIIYNLSVDAAAPWLRNALSCVFEVTVDAGNVQIEQVALKDAMMAVTRRSNSNEAEISSWVHGRIEHPLHRFDVSGMIWGMGRWFNAAIERAKVFRWMDIQYNRYPISDKDKKLEQDDILTRERCIELARFLDTTQHFAFDADVTLTAGGKKFRKKLMLHWEIKLDWTGGLASDLQISTSGIPEQAEAGLKTIFATLLPRVGLREAFDEAWKLMHSDSDEYKMGGSKEKAKKQRS